jgi:hypothetical protein
VVAALKESHADENKFHSDQLVTLQTQYEKLQFRLDAMYENNLQFQKQMAAFPK